MKKVLMADDEDDIIHFTQKYLKRYNIDVTTAENVPSMTDSSSMTLGTDARLIYTLGHAVFDFVEEQWGKDDIRQFLLRFRQSPSGRVATVYDQAFGMTQAEFDSAFVQYLRARFGIQSTPSRGQPQGVTPLPPAGSAALMRNIELRFPTQGGRPYEKPCPTSLNLNYEST